MNTIILLMKISKPKFWDKRSLSLLSLIFLPLAYLYKLIFWIKTFLIKPKNFSVPIICVGNIYIGGTGKTPISMKIYEILKGLRMNPVIIKKNYRDQKDEILLIKKYSQILVGKRRSQVISSAIKKNFDSIILDDGFQDTEIKKNINIVCFNSKQKIGNGLTIPAGPLREGLNSLVNCDLILFNGKKDLEFEAKLNKFNAKLRFVYYEYVPENIERFKNNKLIAFAGIGNPENFFDLLKKNKLNVIKEISYPDHYDYSKKNLDYMIQLKDKYGAKLITTEKDYMRIDPGYHENFDFLKIKMNLDNKDFLNNFFRKNIL
tara:strand:- start:9363 stop:10316 length:954 start_codon:yes stop_codon:yes gene_type:complete